MIIKTNFSRQNSKTIAEWQFLFLMIGWKNFEQSIEITRKEEYNSFGKC